MSWVFVELLLSFSLAGDFMKDGAVYEDMMDFRSLKKFMEDKLEDYNMEPGVIAMNLVLFRDAIEHGIVTKYSRVLHHKYSTTK